MSRFRTVWEMIAWCRDYRHAGGTTPPWRSPMAEACRAAELEAHVDSGRNEGLHARLGEGAALMLRCLMLLRSKLSEGEIDLLLMTPPASWGLRRYQKWQAECGALAWRLRGCRLP